jgi:malate dehydrogenase (oxaloacetate-decarboxylating)
LENALRLTDRLMETTRVVVSGAGAAGVAVTRILLAAGVPDVSVVDRTGVLNSSRGSLNDSKKALAEVTADVTGRSGSLAEVMAGADVFIGVSGGTVSEEIVATMASDSIIFGLANPSPEVHPEVAHRHARVVATGRSDYPNQINNVLAFPGIFRGAFDAKATAITEAMKLAAADALAGIVADEAREDLIIPSPFDPRVGPAVAKAVAEAARRDGVARR